MSESSHLSRRNAYHSNVRRSTSGSSTFSSLSSSSTFSNSSTPSTFSENDPLYQAPTRNSLYLKATEVNNTALKMEQAREKRRFERQKLEEEGEWTTGCAILGSERPLVSEGEAWRIRGDGGARLAGSKFVDQQFSIASLTPSSQLHLPLFPTPLPPSPPESIPYRPSTKSIPTSRPSLYPLVIPTQPSERPRSLQPLSRIQEEQMLESSGSRRHSWTGGSKFTENVDVGPVDRWGTKEVISWVKNRGFGPRVVQVFEDNYLSGSQLLQLDSDRLKAMGITAFGTRFRLVESIRELSIAVVPSPSAFILPSGDASSPPPPSSPETPRPPPPQFNVLITSTHSSPIDSPSVYSIYTLTPTRSEQSTPIQRQPSIPVVSPLNMTLSSRRPGRPLDLCPPLPPPKPNSIPFYPEVDLQGSLQVRHTRSGKIEERWCMIVRGVGELMIFESRLDENPVQTIPLQGYKIISTFDPSSPSSSTSSLPSQPTFSFHLLHRRSPTWFFVASSESSAHGWMKALMKGTVARDYNTMVWSSVVSNTIPLLDAQEKCRRSLLPEELRDENKRRKRSTENVDGEEDGNEAIRLLGSEA